MAFDYKKEYKEYYLPKKKPEIIEVPRMNFIAVRGVGDPNEEGGAYKEAISYLYTIAFTIKMSKKGSHKIEGYFDYVVPPLEGFWTQIVREEENKEDGGEYLDLLWPVEDSGKRKLAALKVKETIDFTRKEDFCWISVIRLPDFVTKEDFTWAVKEAEKKKKQDFSKVEFLTVEEGLCVQCMHIGAFDEEAATIEKMNEYLLEHGYDNDFGKDRWHHEIYLSDARRVPPERWKTVIRHPVKKILDKNGQE